MVIKHGVGHPRVVSVRLDVLIQKPDHTSDRAADDRGDHLVLVEPEVPVVVVFNVQQPKAKPENSAHQAG